MAGDSNSSPQSAFVTGATGFIGAHVCSELLKAGWTVRAAARTEVKAKGLVDALLKLHPDAKDKLSTVIVPDMCVESAYDDSVKDVQYIFHLAAVCQLFSSTPMTVFNSAVQGTKSLLNSALRNGNALKRFVHTSSSGAVYDFGLKGYELSNDIIYTEENWNHEAVQYTLAQGDEAFPVVAYLAAKNQSEWDLWEFMKEHKPAWDAVSLNPPFVYGPLIHPCNSPHELNDSIEMIYTFCSQVKPREFLRPRMRFDDYIDVRDCAQYHLRAAITPEAGGQRFICNAGPVSDNQIARIIKKAYPLYGAGITSTGWNPEEGGLPVTSSTKAVTKVLGRLNFIDLETSIVDSVASIRHLIEAEKSATTQES